MIWNAWKDGLFDALKVWKWGYVKSKKKSEIGLKSLTSLVINRNNYDTSLWNVCMPTFQNHKVSIPLHLMLIHWVIITTSYLGACPSQWQPYQGSWRHGALLQEQAPSGVRWRDMWTSLCLRSSAKAREREKTI